MIELKCLDPSCGSTEYYTELKANNNVARCSKCDRFIKNIPYAPPTMYIGKYKGVEVDKIEDLSYLQWAHENMATIGKSLRDAIRKRIDHLEHLAK